MTGITEILLAIMLLCDLWLAASSRLLHCIRLASWQGLVIGLFPLAVWNWGEDVPPVSLFFAAAASLFIKGWLLPVLLRRTMYKAEVRRELEPLVGYSASVLIVLAAAAFFFWFSGTYLRPIPQVPVLTAPAAFTGMFAGLFIIIARRKAITQAIGFLFFENGITVFGLGMMLDYGLIVELGMLLDIFVLIFVMGIAVFHISREFSHIDSDRLNLLSDDEHTEERSCGK